ncbi:hypothetical protein TcasGA2_TC001676 [Tribolium castaneum]|uniref:Uncharacterized protein n=1 Tax=Tribolium castaneum TaxID=7070 RepID=A0A139WCE1_TRICA|nr:hypothetical protein TcasGA2_TC001676 [Tribolium castaneum]
MTGVWEILKPATGNMRNHLGTSSDVTNMLMAVMKSTYIHLAIKSEATRVSWC